ncbi:MAG: hypothetical protein WCH10_04100 [bacterium]
MKNTIIELNEKEVIDVSGGGPMKAYMLGATVYCLGVVLTNEIFSEKIESKGIFFNASMCVFALIISYDVGVMGRMADMHPAERDQIVRELSATESGDSIIAAYCE